MAKKVYHLPLEDTLQFIKENKSDLNKLIVDKNYLEYTKLLGKSYYYLEIEEFITFFKIDKDIIYSLNTITFFHSTNFLDEVSNHLNFSQFNLEQNNTNKKDFFYAFCYLLNKKDNKLYKKLISKLLLHYHTTFKNNTNVNIDYKDMAITIAKSKNIIIKESFGEEENNSFFNILINDKIIIEEKGKLIKTLRKKAYKKFFHFILDFECEEKSINIYDKLNDLKII